MKRLRFSRAVGLFWCTYMWLDAPFCIGFTRQVKYSLRPPAVLQATSTAAPPQSASEAPVSVGFVGCGTIAKAIATGLATQHCVSVQSIAVSRRSESKSTALRDDFPDLVSIYDDNQEVVDKSDLVFISVLPQQTSAVLKKLCFDASRHTLISVVSTSTLTGLTAESGLPKDCVHKMICLPSVARQEGVSLLVPPTQRNSTLKSILESLGGCVQCENEEKMSSLMVPSGMMGPMYGLLRHNRDWLVERGASKKDASFIVCRIYWGMMQDAERVCENPDAFDKLIEEQTPGGLNEQALVNLEKLGIFLDYDTAMNALLERIEGRSDGSL